MEQNCLSPPSYLTHPAIVVSSLRINWLSDRWTNNAKNSRNIIPSLWDWEREGGRCETNYFCCSLPILRFLPRSPSPLLSPKLHYLLCHLPFKLGYFRGGMFKWNFPGRWPILSKVDVSQVKADNGNALADAGRLNLMDLGSGAGQQKDRAGRGLTLHSLQRLVTS